MVCEGCSFVDIIGATYSPVGTLVGERIGRILSIARAIERDNNPTLHK